MEEHAWKRWKTVWLIAVLTAATAAVFAAYQDPAATRTIDILMAIVFVLCLPSSILTGIVVGKLTESLEPWTRALLIAGVQIVFGLGTLPRVERYFSSERKKKASRGNR